MCVGVQKQKIMCDPVILKICVFNSIDLHNMSHYFLYVIKIMSTNRLIADFHCENNITNK